MAIHEVEWNEELATGNTRTRGWRMIYASEMLEEFLEADPQIGAAEVDIPKNTTPSTMQIYLKRAIEKKSIQDEVKARTASGKVYIIRIKKP